MSISDNRPTFGFILACLGVGLLLSVLLPVFLLPILVYRWLVLKYAKYFRHDLSHPMRGHGGMMISDGPHVDVHLNMLLAFKVRGALDFEKTKTMFMDRLIRKNNKKQEGQLALHFPELQQYVTRWGGYFFWKWETNFTIDGHVGMRKVEAWEDVGKLQVEFLKEPLAKNKSPWLALLLDEGPSASHHHILFKYHHSLSDGYGIVRTLMECADEPAIFLGAPADPPRPLAAKLKEWVKFPVLALAEFTKMAMISSPALPWPSIPPEATCGIGTRDHNISVSTTGGQAISMELVKRVVKQHGVSATSAIYAGLAGGLRSFLVDKYGAQSIPDHITCPQTVPTTGHPEGLLNQINTITYRLPVGDPDIKSRVHAIDQWLNERKVSLEPTVTFYIFELMTRWIPFQLRVDYKPLFPLATTNLPGPLKQVRFAGQEVDGMRLMMEGLPTSCYISMMSYNGTLEWVCNGDSRALSQDEVERLGKLIAVEFESLAKLSSE